VSAFFHLLLLPVSNWDRRHGRGATAPLSISSACSVSTRRFCGQLQVTCLLYSGQLHFTFGKSLHETGQRQPWSSTISMRETKKYLFLTLETTLTRHETIRKQPSRTFIKYKTVCERSPSTRYSPCDLVECSPVSFSYRLISIKTTSLRGTRPVEPVRRSMSTPFIGKTMAPIY